MKFGKWYQKMLRAEPMIVFVEMANTQYCINSMAIEIATHLMSIQMIASATKNGAWSQMECGFEIGAGYKTSRISICVVYNCSSGSPAKERGEQKTYLIYFFAVAVIKYTYDSKHLWICQSVNIGSLATYLIRCQNELI